MKHCLVTLAALLAAASAYSQGTVNFVNKGAGVDARIYYASAATPAVGGGTTAETQFVAQLYQLTGTVGPVGPAVPFRNSGTGTGYFPATTVALNGVALGAGATVSVRAWSTGLGATYEAAKATGGGFGESLPVVLAATGGGGSPPGLPAMLTGLTSFTIAPIPEPTIAALGLLGAGLLLIRRKK